MNNDNVMARKIAKIIKEHGGTAYYVGGYVRDKLLDIPSKDIDIEVHGLSQEQLEKILRETVHFISVGKSFGIYKVAGHNIDIALPRKEVSTGRNHRDFDILIEEHIDIYNAAKRRDFTMNAIIEDVLTGELTDHFGGIDDINNKVIRHIDDVTFLEDPLRVLRAASFAARFHFTISDETIELCKRIDITTLSRERVFEELIKVFTKSTKPSIFFNALDAMNQLTYWFYEIKALQKIEQNVTHHLEGNVYNHTMMVLDEAVKNIHMVNQPVNYMFSALCHDLGKIVTTKNNNGKILALKHEIEGIDNAKTLLKRITNNKKLIQYVSNMVKLHMRPNICAKDNAKLKSTNKLFFQSVDPNDLIYLSIADNHGRISAKPIPSPEPFLFDRLHMYHSIMEKPHITGYDLLNNGVAQNEQFSIIMDYAIKLRLADVPKDEALKQTIAYANNLNKEKSHKL